MTARLIVGPDGTISFPLAGHLVAAGQTLQAVESALRGKLKDNYNTPLDVTVALSSSLANDQANAAHVSLCHRRGQQARGLSAPGEQPDQRHAGHCPVRGFSPFAATSRIVINRPSHGQPNCSSSSTTATSNQEETSVATSISAPVTWWSFLKKGCSATRSLVVVVLVGVPTGSAGAADWSLKALFSETADLQRQPQPDADFAGRDLWVCDGADARP